ncbi:tRNA (adenosine(37)-N6)-threonylcarbamoyltransferase complex dimerization subunit type 1 TsaB [Afifella pfennigii]|uniref:tRNA (adenosine(37)-N6)-threonylcarbamoyltransferase complex dimerization subunit type 1 TsaB n=1 Tax=Afifella pfennigii TaxID=209897 RepID=UPI00047DA871|nr:tRNA (adenosine(37)-N6)-threonylcarbamoyltransferase complex dimerization subunit type 1 TsaB [Afifella pfennigii]
MICLALDTSGELCAVALAASDKGGARLLARAEEAIGRGHAERLFPLIDQALQEAALGYGDVELVATTTGPGSFTGVRIGVAAARGLALALAIPARGIDVLEAMIEAARGTVTGGVIAALLPAGRGNLYLRAEAAAGGVLLASRRLAEADAPSLLSPHAGNGLLLTGAAAASVAEALREAGVSASCLGKQGGADIGVVATMALSGRGESPPAPVYLRPPDAKPQTGKAVARQ